MIGFWDECARDDICILLFTKPKIMHSESEVDSFAAENYRLLNIIKSQQNVIQQQLELISNFKKASGSVHTVINHIGIAISETNRKKRKLVIFNFQDAVASVIPKF